MKSHRTLSRAATTRRRRDLPGYRGNHRPHTRKEDDMRPRIALAFVVTFATAAAFIVCGLFTVIAAARWAFDLAPGSELLRAIGVWLASFVLMQSWSFYLRVGKP